MTTSAAALATRAVVGLSMTASENAELSGSTAASNGDGNDNGNDDDGDGDGDGEDEAESACLSHDQLCTTINHQSSSSNQAPDKMNELTSEPKTNKRTTTSCLQ